MQQMRYNSRFYGRGLLKDILPQRFFDEGNKFLKKIMVSVVVTQKGVSLSFFVCGSEINGTPSMECHTYGTYVEI